METDCHIDVKNQEKQIDEETSRNWKDFEWTIASCWLNPEDFTEVFKKVLEKSIYDKAIDKAKNSKKKDDDEDESSK